jgi:hypothetical protein
MPFPYVPPLLLRLVVVDVVVVLFFLMTCPFLPLGISDWKRVNNSRP